MLFTRVTKYKYHGHTISDDLSDDYDMARQYLQIYAQGNTLLRKFIMGIESVKKILRLDHFVRLYSYTHANYGGTIRSESLRKLCVAYNNVVRL